MNLNNFSNKGFNEEKRFDSKYPIIWKIESCFKGECKDERTSHRWSVPATTPAGLMTECYDCHKTRNVRVDGTR